MKTLITIQILKREPGDTSPEYTAAVLGGAEFNANGISACITTPKGSTMADLFLGLIYLRGACSNAISTTIQKLDDKDIQEIESRALVSVRRAEYIT